MPYPYSEVWDLQGKFIYSREAIISLNVAFDVNVEGICTK